MFCKLLRLKGQLVRPWLAGLFVRYNTQILALNRTHAHS
jgi:hypothetical protein